MTKPAVICGSLVDVRNIGVHKSVRLTIHVPQELAMRVFECFSWPTNAEPVSVAIARLTDEHTRQSEEDEGDKAAQAISDAAALQGHNQKAPIRHRKEKLMWSEMTPSQQAGILSNDHEFWSFCNDEKISPHIVRSEDSASFAIRDFCRVASRADLTPENTQWAALVARYRAWQRQRSSMEAIL